MIAEPMTVFTDLLIAVFAGWIAWRLLHSAGPQPVSLRLWAMGIALQGLGAFAGAIFHGFAPTMTLGSSAALWFVTQLFLGLATSTLVSGIGFAALPKKIAVGLAIGMAVKFIAYAVWCGFQPEFLPALIDQILSALILIALLAIGRKSMDRAATLLAVGLAAVFVGGLIQFLHLAPHPHFNHNDLYHVFALFSLGCFYIGSRRLTDYQPA